MCVVLNINQDRIFSAFACIFFLYIHKNKTKFSEPPALPVGKEERAALLFLKGSDAMSPLKIVDIIISAASALLVATKSILKIIDCVDKLKNKPDTNTENSNK